MKFRPNYFFFVIVNINVLNLLIFVLLIILCLPTIDRPILMYYDVVCLIGLFWSVYCVLRSLLSGSSFHPNWP